MFSIPDCEFRHLDSGVGKESGNRWYRVRFEDEQGRSFNAFVPEEHASAFFGLSKGTMIDLQAELSTRANNLTVNIVGWSDPESVA